MLFTFALLYCSRFQASEYLYGDIYYRCLPRNIPSSALPPRYVAVLVLIMFSKALRLHCFATYPAPTHAVKPSTLARRLTGIKYGTTLLKCPFYLADFYPMVHIKPYIQGVHKNLRTNPVDPMNPLQELTHTVTLTVSCILRSTDVWFCPPHTGYTVSVRRTSLTVLVLLALALSGE